MELTKLLLSETKVTPSRAETLKQYNSEEVEYAFKTDINFKSFEANKLRFYYEDV